MSLVGVALLLSFVLPDTPHTPSSGRRQTRLIRKTVTGCYLALLIGNNDELLPVVRPALIFLGDPESLSGKKWLFGNWRGFLLFQSVSKNYGLSVQDF